MSYRKGVQADTTARQIAYREKREHLAAFVAEGGSINAYARIYGLDRRGVQRAWKRIRDDREAQAV